MVLKPLGEKDVSIDINNQTVADEAISESTSYTFDVVAYDTFSASEYGSESTTLWNPNNHNLQRPSMDLVEASITIDVNYTQGWQIEDLDGNIIKDSGFEYSWEKTYTGSQDVLNRGYKFVEGGNTQDDTYTADVHIRWEVTDPNQYEITQVQ